MTIFEAIKGIRVMMIQRIEKLEDLVYSENEDNKGKFQSLDEAKIEFKTDVLIYKNDL